MWSKALTLQYHSEPFESTPVAFLRKKQENQSDKVDLDNISLQHESTKTKKNMSDRQTSNGDTKER